jgi:hypothetical protein
MMTVSLDNLVCRCHGVLLTWHPYRRRAGGGYLRCTIKYRATKARYNTSAKGRASRARYTSNASGAYGRWREKMELKAMLIAEHRAKQLEERREREARELPRLLRQYEADPQAALQAAEADLERLSAQILAEAEAAAARRRRAEVQRIAAHWLETKFPAGRAVQDAH